MKPEEALNTSDHLPVTLSLDMALIPQVSTECKMKSRTKWGKISDEVLRDRYTIPVSECCDELLTRYVKTIPQPEHVDLILDRLSLCMRECEGSLPKTKPRAHQKSFWSSELSKLKKDKVKCYRDWVSEGRPRDSDNQFWVNHKKAKKIFAKRIKEISKKYESDKIEQAISSSELNINQFWRMLKRERTSGRVKVLSIKNKQDKVVHDVSEILETWRSHFSELSTPMISDKFDEDHFNRVTKEVHEFTKTTDLDMFSDVPFEYDEIAKGIEKLNSNKTPGYDEITKENLIAGGPKVTELLCLVFNLILTLEYVPENFRLGIQVPLYKGKNASTLETNSYRGITLLSTYNKLYEVVLWGRMSKWWEETSVVSRLQGACRRGYSCLHTALMLQEAIATLLETNPNVFVLYLDVRRAFDSVWVDGLFHRLYALGVTGRTWRILYKTYVNFRCRVRVNDDVSEWYPMMCGIHQGGYLSLIKYTAFIDSLIVTLEQSGACASVYGIHVSPLGYADDIASASISERDIDKVLRLADRHSREWRYEFNAKKSAVSVFGKTTRQYEDDAQHRQYLLGPERVKETKEYDHVGLKSCAGGKYSNRTIEKIKKGRKTLNAASGIGLRRGGLNMRACSFIFWSLIVPIVTFASELWVMGEEDVRLLDDFQIYSGRRVQRFSFNTPRESSFVGLGWMRLESFIAGKKLLFIRTIIKMKDQSPVKMIFVQRCIAFDRNIEDGLTNKFDSPIFNILRMALCFNLYNEVMRMVKGLAIFSKTQWSKMVWRKAWQVEDTDWFFRSSLLKYTLRLSKTMGDVCYLVWWQISDRYPALMKTCETMAKFVCRSSLLKNDDYRFKNDINTNQICQLCDLYAVENIQHVAMHCTHHEEVRTRMLLEIDAISPQLFTNDPDVFNILLGKNVPSIDIDIMTEVWICAGKAICNMYYCVLNSRAGIG